MILADSKSAHNYVKEFMAIQSNEIYEPTNVNRQRNACTARTQPTAACLSAYTSLTQMLT